MVPGALSCKAATRHPFYTAALARRTLFGHRMDRRRLARFRTMNERREMEFPTIERVLINIIADMLSVQG